MVIVDEMSMMERRMLRVLDERLRQAKACPDQPFGGLSMVLVGDFGQLPPIGDVEMFSKEKKDGQALSTLGVQTFDTLTHSIVLATR